MMTKKMEKMKRKRNKIQRKPAENLDYLQICQPITLANEKEVSRTNRLIQGQALHLDRGLFEIFRNLLLAKLSKNDTNIICRSLKKKLCFPKFEDCSPKIKSATVILSLIFSRAWQSYFLCHTHAFL